MRRRALQLLSLLRSAMGGLRSSPVTSVIAVLTISVSLVLVGAFSLVLGNMEDLLESFGEELRVTAYLTGELTEDEQRELASRVATVEGVRSVELISRDEALSRFERTVGGAALLAGLESNPLPPSLEIALLAEDRTPEGLARLASALDGLPGVEELAHTQEWVEGYARAIVLVRSAAIGLAGVLGLAALLIVANTIRLAAYAREDEIEILALVGASRTFVRLPFLIEGTLQGAAGGLLAVAVLYVAFRLLVPQVEYGLEFLLGSAAPRFFDARGMVGLVAGGAGLGVLGSAAALVGWRR